MAIDPTELKGRKLGRVLTKMGTVSREQVHEALAIQKTRKVPIGQLLTELGYCTEQHVNAGLAGQAGMAYIDLSTIELEPSVVETVPAVNARAYQIVPIAFNPTAKRLTIAMKNPDNYRAVDDLRLLLSLNVEAVVADEASIDRLIKEYYSKQESVMDVISGLTTSDKFADLAGRGDSIDLDAITEMASDNQVVKLINLVLLQAIKDRASDIHFEPFEEEFKMRYRIDGVLYEMVPPPKHLGPAITSRIKVMSNLDIAERRLPQDGRIELTVGGNQIDLRVAVLPTMYGESVVLRVLDRSHVQLDLDRIGFRPDDLTHFRALIHKPNGIVIVTGPTGSGKTTTLYAALAELNTIETKILTAEDPVEYDIDGLCQCQVNEDLGLTFARCLRSFLRQDPDIILVGEIRDLETAQIAVQASLTGHLVLTTLHTNDAIGAIDRLIDLGAPPFAISSSLLCSIGQRLVRRLCQHCAGPAEPNALEREMFGLHNEDCAGLRGPVGCSRCAGTGYAGRLGVYELLGMDVQIRRAIHERASATTILDLARRQGMRTMSHDGLEKALSGLTSLEELGRVRATFEDREEPNYGESVVRLSA
ncbi:MAG: Flp pilus assembly complex ATPase component TadA [Planctomycetes bacterium]|nr:Flp pilus assembly complex ATPase component TadA [Planctomycetota bacterium]